MGKTSDKGNMGQTAITLEALKRGYKVAIPFGEGWQYDLVVDRNGKLERVQCKYTESDGEIINVRCQSSNSWGTVKYTKHTIDWLAVYDNSSGKCYFIPGELMGDKGRRSIFLRLSTPKRRTKNMHFANEFEEW